MIDQNINSVFLNSYRLILVLVSVLILGSCGNGNLSNNPPANPTSVSYGGNYQIAQNITEDFEQGHKDAYRSGNVAFKTGAWLLEDALTGNSEADYKTGKQASCPYQK